MSDKVKPVGSGELMAWLFANGKTQAALARRLGLDPVQLNNRIMGRARFKPIEAFAIEEISGGDVNGRRLLLTEQEHASPLRACKGGEP